MHTSPRPDRHDLGRALRALRKEAGLSAEALSYRAGVHETYITGIERGERNPSFESIGKILAGLGIAWEILGRRLDRAAEEWPRE